MADPERIRDIVKFGVMKDVIGSIKKNISILDDRQKYITKNLERNDRNLLLFQILLKANIYLICLKQSLSQPTEVIALVTRGLFELLLITKYVISDDKNLKSFLDNRIFDEIEIIEGLLEFHDGSNAQAVAKLENEIKELERLAKKYDSKKTRIIWKQLAIDADLESDYNALYKLLSKYVHPSAYALTSLPSAVHSDKIRNSFVIYSQLYAGYIIGLIDKAINYHPK
jgi:hypothetical protein